MGADAAAVVGWKPVVGTHVKRQKAPAAARVLDGDLKDADDRTLVEAFIGGRRDAFDVIVTRHERQVYQLCYRFVGNHEDAADLAQDVFVRAFKGLGKFKGDAALSTWLYRVGVNVCLNRVTSKRPVADRLEGMELADERTEDSFAHVARGEQSVALKRAIRQLPPKQRAAVILRVYQELSHEQIAGILGSSVGAVKANFFHALGNLRRILGPS